MTPDAKLRAIIAAHPGGWRTGRDEHYQREVRDARGDAVAWCAGIDGRAVAAALVTLPAVLAALDEARAERDAARAEAQRARADLARRIRDLHDYADHRLECAWIGGASFCSCGYWDTTARAFDGLVEEEVDHG